MLKMDRILFEDGNGNLMDEEGTEVSVIEMEVDVEEFSLGEITNYDIYIDLKPPEKPVKIKHEENDTASEEEKKIIKQGITDYTNPMSKIFFYLVYEKGSGIRVAAKELKVSQSSAQIWMSKAKQAGDDGFVGRRSGGGRPEVKPSTGFQHNLWMFKLPVYLGTSNINVIDIRFILCLLIFENAVAGLINDELNSINFETTKSL
ncbi:hypothetical protein CU098_013384 [Rhizopus stolonifer]|uniref:Uncharacterized protein n=1 Tax=Rhizopus stolonifer TaxID=4846 RepID=A0A367KUW5_RHIST|nr:hypothetical protein CU098_013384 [Rhizopus stolonifer]